MLVVTNSFGLLLPQASWRAGLSEQAPNISGRIPNRAIGEHRAKRRHSTIQDIANSMLTFFVPQMEQLGLCEQDARHGSLSTMDSDIGTGVLWALSLSDDCLYTYNDVQPEVDLSFMEYPDDSICLSCMSRDSAKQVPLSRFAGRDWNDRNILSFRMTNSPISCRVTQNERCCSHSIVLLPSFFDRLEGLTDAERQKLFDFLSASDESKLPTVLGSLFSRLVPTLSRRPDGKMYCAAKVNEILSAVTATALAPIDDDVLSGASAAEGLTGKANVRHAENRAVAREAKCIIDERFDEKLTTSKLSKVLYVGRTRLCEAFRDEYHLGVGEYLRMRRMEEGTRLLVDTSLTVSQIARAVGYAHASSFIEAYREYCGMSPACMRASTHGGDAETASGDSSS